MAEATAKEKEKDSGLTGFLEVESGYKKTCNVSAQCQLKNRNQIVAKKGLQYHVENVLRVYPAKGKNGRSGCKKRLVRARALYLLH